MNLVELTTFLAVVELKSLVRAARRLNVTQSTVTARIDSLEERLGQKLLHRHKSGTEVTSAGFKLQRYAEVMTQLWRQAQFEIGLPQGFTGVCNVGCYYDLWAGYCAPFLERLRRDQPRVAVAAWPGDQTSIDRWLASGLIDIAFCHASEAREPFRARELGLEELVRVEVAGDRPGAGEAAYVYVDYGEQFRRAHAVSYPASAPASVTLASAQWAIDHLARSGGSGYLPRRLLPGLEARCRVSPVAGAPVLAQAVHLVENTSVTRHWPWWEAAVAGLGGD